MGAKGRGQGPHRCRQHTWDSSSRSLREVEEGAHRDTPVHISQHPKAEDAGGCGGWGGRKYYWEIDHIARLRDIACRSKYVGSMRRARFAVVGGSLSKAGRLGRTRIGLECQVLT